MLGIFRQPLWRIHRRRLHLDTGKVKRKKTSRITKRHDKNLLSQADKTELSKNGMSAERNFIQSYDTRMKKKTA